MNTKTITLTLSGARPNNMPCMVLDEKRTLTIAAAPIAGSSTLSAVTLTASPANLTIGTASISGKNATISVTAAQPGCYSLKPKVTLSNGEIFEGLVNMDVIQQDPGMTLYPTG